MNRTLAVLGIAALGTSLAVAGMGWAQTQSKTTKKTAGKTDPEAAKRGKDLFQEKCSTCHYDTSDAKKIGPGLNTFSSVPETTGLRQAALGALVCVAVAFFYARSRYGRLLRATREDNAAARAVGASVYGQRLVAFTVSGLLAGLAGGLYVHLLPVQIDSVYLDLTFITLAMLVVGGTGSLFGAVVGALAVSALDSWLAVAENGTSLFGWHIDLPSGTADIVVGVLMAAVLILRPSGLTGGRELRLWR